MEAVTTPQYRAVARRILAGNVALAQVWFDARVLDKYRQSSSCKIIRTNTVGRLKASTWSLDFGIGGDDSALIHVSAREAVERIPEGEREHWEAYALALPASGNYLLMQMTRGACIDDGDVQPW